MVTNRIAKLLTLIFFSLLFVWQVSGHPNFLNQYALDPRSKTEFRTNCAICHQADGKQSDLNFLTEFGKEFVANQNKISPAMRERFDWLFNSAETEVSGVATEIVKLNTDQVVINVTVKDSKGKYIDRKSTRLNSSHPQQSRMPSSA